MAGLRSDALATITWTAQGGCYSCFVREGRVEKMAIKDLKIPRFVVGEREALVISRRVLRLVRGYIRRQPPQLLITDGRGLMTWEEVLYHVRGALALRVKGGKPCKRIR